MTAPRPAELTFLARVECDVAPWVGLGALPLGERRYVPLGGGTVRGPRLNGVVVPGGVDWQLLRSDGVLEIAAHYVIRCEDGALVEVQSQGLRHGPPEVMQRLARGEPVAPHEYYFRTAVRFATAAPAWADLNRVIAVALGQREAQRVLLDFHTVG